MIYDHTHHILAGSEYLKCCPFQALVPTGDYDASADGRFYADSPASGFAVKLGAGYFAVVFPDDAHIPQLVVGEPGEVKKVVVKVEVGRRGKGLARLTWLSCCG